MAVLVIDGYVYPENIDLEPDDSSRWEYERDMFLTEAERRFEEQRDNELLEQYEQEQEQKANDEKFNKSLGALASNALKIWK